MGQVLHGSATTTHAVRAAIQRSKASIQALSERLYVDAAISMGAGTGRILARHLLPNLLPTVVVLATLSQLRSPRYGYELRQILADQGMPIEEGTLYPLLRRLETQGLLNSEWRIEDGPPR